MDEQFALLNFIWIDALRFIKVLYFSSFLVVLQLQLKLQDFYSKITYLRYFPGFKIINCVFLSFENLDPMS